MALPAAKPTRGDYYALIDAGETKAEWVNGEIYLMSGGTLEHSAIAMSLGSLLFLALRGRPCRVFNSDLMIAVEETDLHTYPDLSVVCGAAERLPTYPNAVTNPTVLVEVLSPSTAAFDRGAKFEHYRRLPSLQEYVLVHPDAPKIEVYRRVPEGWLFQVYVGFDARMPLRSLEVEIALNEVFSVLANG